jgi:hypothetical protein
MSDDLNIALIGLFAGVIGGFLQAWLGRRWEWSRFMRDNKREAYASLMGSMAVLTFYPEASDEATKAKASVAELRCRIGLFGSSKVIKSLGPVFDHWDFASEIGQGEFAEAMLVMREDMGRSAEESLKDHLRRLVFSTSAKPGAP